MPNSTKWWIRGGRSDGWRNRWVGYGRTAWYQNGVEEEITGVNSRDMVKHNERSDQ